MSSNFNLLIEIGGCEGAGTSSQWKKMFFLLLVGAGHRWTKYYRAIEPAL